MNHASVCRLLGLATLFSALGCAAHGPATETAGAAQTVTIKGSVKGGQQPVVGASVQLYATGSSGDGSAATPLLATPVLTDSEGALNFQFNCPAGNAELYLVATGGNPGLSGGGPNAALAEVAALGTCAQLKAAGFLSVNEVTTVAAIAALAPFASSVTSIGSSASDSTSLQAAFATASAFANVQSGASPGAEIPSGFAVPSTKINTLADVVASCVNSAGGTAGDGSPSATSAILLFYCIRALLTVVSRERTFSLSRIHRRLGVSRNFRLRTLSVTDSRT